MEDVRGVEEVHEPTRNESYLAYLNFAHVQVTGSRLYSVSPEFDGVPQSINIIAACLHEAFDLAEAGEEVCDMSSFNFVET